MKLSTSKTPEIGPALLQEEALQKISPAMFYPNRGDEVFSAVRVNAKSLDVCNVCFWFSSLKIIPEIEFADF